MGKNITLKVILRCPQTHPSPAWLQKAILSLATSWSMIFRKLCPRLLRVTWRCNSLRQLKVLPHCSWSPHTFLLSCCHQVKWVLQVFEEIQISTKGDAATVGQTCKVAHLWANTSNKTINFVTMRKKSWGAIWYMYDICVSSDTWAANFSCPKERPGVGWGTKRTDHGEILILCLW